MEGHVGTGVEIGRPNRPVLRRKHPVNAAVRGSKAVIQLHTAFGRSLPRPDILVASPRLKPLSLTASPQEHELW
jgi:hypothetical protein